MNNKEVDINTELARSKAREIGEIIDGMTLPEVFCAIGTVIVELIFNASDQGYKVDNIVADWLSALVKNIRNASIMLDMSDQKVS